MASVYEKLLSEGFLNSPPRYIHNNICYETIVGSISYGSNLTQSDMDVRFVAIPSKEVIFPHTCGYLPGFSKNTPKFEQFKQHEIDYHGQRKYDIQGYNIVKYFRLLTDNNPEVIDSIFTPQDCILSINAIGQMIRDNRTKFLHKGSYYKFVAYAKSQLHKMASNKREGKRKAIYEEFGFDVKFASHLVRLAYEAEQILMEGDLDLRRNREHLKAIKRGEVSEADIRNWFADKEKYLLKCFHDSKLQEKPDEDFILQLLMNCLEHHFGSLDKAITIPAKHENALRQINQILENVGIK